MTPSADLIVLAHGVGGRSDLPIPEWRAAWGAFVILVLSFAALGLLWPRALLRSAARGRHLGTGADRVTRLLGVVAGIVGAVLSTVVLSAGLIGPDTNVSNIAPVGVYVVFWVGVPLLSALLGDIWRAFSPWEALGRLVDASPRALRPAPGLVGAGWPALIPVGAFLWLELAYHDGARPRVLAWAGIAYTVCLLALARRFGWAVARRSEGFGMLFGAVGAVSPLYRSDGRLRIRPPFSGLARLETPTPVVAILLVAIGGTAFDGFSRTRFWGDILTGRSGWEATLVNTVGLAWVVLLVGLAYHLACRVGGRVTGDQNAAERFGVSLVPILLGYSVAHYFSLLLLEGQAFRSLLSDPYGRGWDLFGTLGDPIDWTLVSTTVVGWVQLAAILVGHMVAVVVAHDRAIEAWPPAKAMRSQYPMLVVMVAYTMVALVLVAG
ncbi:MAG: hypothetical protein QF796_05210 [Acidimicrobiales bacterium]|nr:fenitrothion hydrolase [Acidimicrobiaceae bacterium]MDP6493380.1 hypothetical protein [Acidimicrobiales bacterium]MDP6649518.1 hypothetical protein [Acidimicrobiales bacterium]MDP6759415.1 hypothetical protein [Acidimicrobiales bacterium]